jgi:phosphate transport system permease protein
MSVSIGNPPVAAVLDGESTIRRHMAAASGRIRRLKQIDRLAVAVITLGGLAVVVSVIGILIFIAAEAYPLFRPATGSLQRTFTFGAAAAPPGAAVLGTDETGRYVYTVTIGGAIAFFAADTGRPLFERIPAGLSGATMTSSSRSLADDFVAIGTADGRVALLQVQFTPVHTDGTVSDVTVDVATRAVLVMDAAARPIRRLSYLEEDGRRFVAAQISDVDIAVAWVDGGTERQAIVQPAGGATVTAIDVGRNATLIAGTSHGAVHHWELRETPVLTDVSNVGASAISALEYVIGNRTFIAGTVDGHVSAWFQAPVGTDDMLQMVRAADFEPQGTGITAIAASTRDRTFATAGADGSVVLRHQTSGRTLVALPGASAVAHLAMTPRSDGVVVARADATVDQFAIANPHPEVSWHTLFGKVWYEGYPRAEYVWQSTGATDDFEPKISLVPLVFGTIKGTVYALIIAVPLAVLGALYTSQFVHPSLRARIKPTVEIMAALPSVVIGFVAGLYLAPMVERHLVGVMLLAVIVPVFGTSGVLVVRLFPAAARRWLSGGSELLVILPLLVAGSWFAFALAPAIETWFFAGDARQWLSTTLGVTYDQRNSLVVGLAMGFAVIPIIFTISEDAFASVPATLSAASLALGASRWQTAVRVIVPTASPGVFSAVMIGFGRAVGETMIVLMATGNTPVLDWSIFNGFRTQSANIAVEIPEAPHGGSLYRTLFLSASLLFAMTFTLNTIAEVIRQRLRQKYRAL